ncbi:MAG TPA: acyltransferase family protein [Aestuariivirga sp.]|nr:acyltransferase family protein [Aestuariivirga sp.]
MPASQSRISWVDYAKGICIVLVVLMHSTLGVEKAGGSLSWLHDFITWAKPFRMPDFFLISGLFLASRINRPWREYLDSKVLHFAYFYILWMTIQFATKGYGLYQANGAEGLLKDYALGFVEPFGTLWFIYMLAVFFVVVKLTRLVPPIFVFLAGAILEMAPIATGWAVIDEFASRFVYFFVGYWLARHVFKFAEGINFKSVPVIVSGLFIWAVVNTVMVRTGLAWVPGLGLALGFVGAAAVVTMGVLLSKTKLAAPVRYFGENSIVIYLAFFLFMAATRSVLLKYNVVADLGSVALLTTAAGVIGPILLFWATRQTKLSLLFRRPAWARLASRPAQWHSDGHVTFNQPEARGPSLSR